MIFFILNSIIDPMRLFALTGGPSQPEVQSFEPIGTSEMVNLFSGDFVYNIPLVDVGGYPINISYHSGVTMDQEASWVGLGWNINPGAITRNMRGIPDDFNGELIDSEFNMKNNYTFGLNSSAILGDEMLGVSLMSLEMGFGVNYNNYKGVGFNVFAIPSIGASLGSAGRMSLGLGVSAGTFEGVTVNPSLSFNASTSAANSSATSLGVGVNVGLSINSRAGLSTLTMGVNPSVSGGSRNIMGESNSKGSRGSVGTNIANSTITFASPTYVPNVEYPMININQSFNATLGGALFGLHGIDIRLKGFYSHQALMYTSESNPAWGYMFSQNAVGRPNAIYDFNREKDGSFSENTPNLPPTNFTYDVFSVSGQGIGGMYRPFRSDVGVVYDKNSFNLGTSPANLGFEVGTGNATHFGIDYQNNTTNTTSGKWKSNESVTGKLKFKGNNPTNRYYEPYYFKNAGEMSYENDMNFFSNIGQYSPVHVALTGPSVSKQAAGNYVEGGSMNTNTRSTRSIRDQHISVLNSEMADKFAASRKIEVFYGFNVSPNGKYIPDQVIDRTSTPYKPNHISEVTVSRPDGARYIYGIPAYNLSQKEVTFAVQQDVTACDDYQISYSPSDADASTNNKGMDNFVSKKSIPPYAHSYLLTHILSVDYVDADDIPGPSDGDYGTYTKINYSKQCENYNWRTPYLNATYNEGMKTFDNDDKASYIFGTKEIWNVHSIESKTHLAEFYLSEREDGRDAGGEHPTGSGNGTSMKLDSIRVFSKQDRIKNGANAIPIKTVHFVYEYLLCPEVLNSNSNSGKLTLTKLYFTYGNSKKGMLNSYVFNYSEENPKYSTHSFDRWGNYKEDNGNGCDFTQEPSNAEYPYAEQDKAKADLFSEAWSLTSIKLPSGGVIDVNYESDDYAYVQNKKAMEMVKVIGATNDINATPNSSLMSSGNSVNNYLIFRLNKPIDVSNSQASNIVQKMLKDEYGNTPEFIYYKFLLELDAGKYEFVPGYCKVEAIGLMPAVSGQYINGYLKITPVGIDDDGGGDPVNPITKSAWNFARLYTPQYVYSQPTNATGSLENVLQALASPFLQIWQFVTGINENLRSRGMGFNFSNSKSYVRLYNGDGFKFGGGSRVKKITIGDSWQTMTNASDNDNMVYGQEYDYTTKTKKGEIISSGVASYEPIIGGDENPWRQPIYYSEEKLMVPDDTYYKETPYGESFFPSPSVGYSKVSVMNLQWKNILINSQNRSVTKHATGKVVNEFYTAKDYPTQVTQTSLDKDRYKHQPLFQILKFESEDYMTASQGYAVILNDMHGKQKAQWVYQEDKNEPISGIEYFYKTNGGYNDIKANSLNNYVQIIKKNNSGGGRITSGMIGVEYDHVVDMREYESTTSGGGANFNLDIFVIPAPIPVTLYIPTLFPSFVYEQTRFRSVVATKVINQYGVLSKTVAHDLGSKISTTNMLWDANTGNVLLTKTQNSFDDPLYSFTYPAHWGYDRMGQVYKNIGIEFYGQSINDLGAGYFVKWDELGLVNGSTVTTGWVSNVVQSGPNPGITVIDRDGNEINPFADYDLIKIIRSGRRNQSSVPIGTVVSMESPIRQVGSEKDIVFDNDTRVVQAQSMEYSDEWRLFCDCGHLPGATINPVIKGIRGNWRPETSYLFLVDRSITRNSDNTDVREDGVFENFNPFWIPSLSGTDWEKDETNWTWATKATEYSPQGFELENKDALGRYSSAVYGYNYSLPVGVASNAMFREIGFDNFEDYDFGHCVQDHFSFKAYPNFVTQDDAHSGKRSIRVGAGVSLGVIKNLIDCGESTYDEYTQQYH